MEFIVVFEQCILTKTAKIILLFRHIDAEFATIARATGIGFLIMGFTGFFVKLIHIPINNIIVGGV